MNSHGLAATIQRSVDSLNFLGTLPRQWQHLPRETLPWELFRGHLLKANQTRQSREFESWHLHSTQAPADGILSLLLDVELQQLFVVRHVRLRTQVAYEEQGAILTRAAEVLHPELIATLPTQLATDEASMRRYLADACFLAFIGTSRLPITSLESPLPYFSMGMLCAWPFQTKTDASHPWTTLSAESVPITVRAKWLEFWMRSLSPAAMAKHTVASGLEQMPEASVLASLLRALFQNVALTPLGTFLDNLWTLLAALRRHPGYGPAWTAEVVGYWLRHLVRHLSAYDLETFHNLGANYPDALLLDGMLEQMRSCIEDAPACFTGKGPTQSMQRRAWLLGLILRKRYEGLPVPAYPSSLGENLRVLPGQLPLPDEELTRPGRRGKRLFADAATEALLAGPGKKVLDQALHDLATAPALGELGMATFLDRPLGVHKAPTEVDRTPLLSYLAYSRTLARNRLDHLQRWSWISKECYEQLVRQWESFRPHGIDVMALTGSERPGVVSLEDARRASPDFAFLRTTRSSLRRLLADFDWQQLQDQEPDLWGWLSQGEVLLIRTPGPDPASLLTAFDASLQPRLTIDPCKDEQGAILTEEWFGKEWLPRGLSVRIGEGRDYHLKAINQVSNGRSG